MSSSHPVRRATFIAAASAAAVVAATVAAAPAANAAPCVIAAAGDVADADDYRTGAARTGELIRAAAPEKVVALGDLAYPEGSRQQFAAYYRPTWGSFKAITEPLPGNHEARTPDFAGIEAEFGDAADDNRAVTVCGWRIVLLNQYKGVRAAGDYLREQRHEHPSMPFIAAWHEPRFSSGRHGSERDMQPLWDAARYASARIVLTAHDHDYERFAPMGSAGNVLPDSGTRQFVSGLGGHNPRRFRDVAPNSERRFTGQPAVLFLTLDPDGSYSWLTRSVDGEVRDSGAQPPRG